MTEYDIINGKLTNNESKLKVVASKLGKYALEKENPYNEIKRFSDDELVKHLSDKSRDAMISLLFEHYNINCINMHKIDNDKLDMLIDNLNKENSDKEKTIHKIITLIRSVTVFDKKEVPIVERIKTMIQKDLASDISVNAIADNLGISLYYMCHIFKKTTGITIIDYKNELKITKAKELLINTNKKITEIASECGFGSDSYFSKVFIASEEVSPTQYRNFMKK